MPSPFQNGATPGTPGAGETSTRSRVISSIRHVDAPSRNVWPSRASYTISSSSSPTRPPPSTRKTPNRPRSGIVPAFVTASRCAPERRARCPQFDPRRSSAAARRTRRTGSGRRACRGRSRAARGTAPRTDTRAARARGARRPRPPPRRRSRRSAAPARRAGSAGCASPRCRRRASRARRRPTRGDRRGTSGRCAPSTPSAGRDPRARRAAGPARPTSGSRPGSRGRRRPCRCRARATTSRRGTGSRPP